MTTPTTPTFEQVWPTHAMDNATGVGVETSVTRPILLAESGEPLEEEGADYLLSESL